MISQNSSDFIDLAAADTEPYLLALALMSDRIVQACHDEQPARIAREIAQALTLTSPAGVDPMTALVTVLAAQVLPTLRLEARLAWVERVVA
jgi:hypothetical protein